MVAAMAVLVGGSFLTACQTTTTGDVKEETKEAVETTKDFLTEKKDNIKNDLEDIGITIVYLK